MSLREILGNDSDRYVIALNGEPIPTEDWELTFISKDDLVLIYGLPGGDNARDLLRIIAIILVIWVAWWAGPQLQGFLGASEGFWTSAIAFIGVVAVGLLLPPILPDQDTGERKRLNSLTGTRNKFAPFEVIPSLYGRHRLYPPIAAMPVTEVIGEDQYLNMIYCIGLGEYTIDFTTVKIGETVATDFEDIEVVFTDQPEALDIFELQQSLVLNQDTEPGDVFTRTTQANTEEISLDFVLPGGLIFTKSNGDKRLIRLHFSVEFRISGSSDPWVFITGTSWNISTQGLLLIGDLPAFQHPPGFTSSAGSLVVSTENTDWLMVSAKSRDPFRVGVRFPTPTSDTWDVRVTRQLTELQGSFFRSTSDQWFKFQAVFVWTALRSISKVLAIQLGPNIASFAVLRVRATDQLRGIIDTFNLIATRNLRSWDKTGQSFNAAAATRDPAWAFLDIFTGLGNARPILAPEIDKIILDDLADWATENATEGRFYDEVVDYSTSVFESIIRASSVGRAGVSNRDGKWTVILEQTSPTPVQFFTPRNSWGFNSIKRFVNFPHAFKVRFNSEDSGYQEDEMLVYDDGFNVGNATQFEVLQLVGITDADFAWKTARYIMAAARLRPEIYSFNADVEHIIAQRGDSIKVAHDIPLWGNSYGRIVDIAGNVVTTDEEVDLDGGTDYVMRVRRDDGTSVIEDLIVGGGINITSHTFTPSIPSGIKIGDLYMLGEVGSETQDLVIISIEPQNELTARLVCLDLSPAILTADTGTIPPFDPNITLPIDPTQLVPLAPFNVAANSDENVYIIDGAGVLIPRIIISWDLVAGSANRWGTLEAELRYREFDSVDAPGEELGTWRHIPNFNAFQASTSIDQVNIGVEFEIQMRTITQYSVPSKWSSAILHTVGGATRFPPAVDGLIVSGVAGGFVLQIDLTSLDIRTGSHIEIHYNIVNDRDEISPAPVIFPLVIPQDLTVSTTIVSFLAIDDLVERFFWARLIDVYSTASTYVPVSPTAGVAATPLAAVGTIYYIKALNGTAIHNGVGNLTIEARIIEGGVDTLLSAGTIQLFDPSNDIVNVANGYQTGSDGYTGVLDSSNINFDIVITMKDGAGGDVLDTISLVDIADGLSVFIGNVFLRAASPPATPTVDSGQYNFTTQVLTPPTSPVTWFTEPPAGSDPLYVSSGSFNVVGQTGIDTTVVWTSPDLLIQDGDPGDDGLSIHVANVYQRASSPPSTPSVNDGEYNFGTLELTPPSGWDVEPPAGSDPLYVSTGSFNVQGTTGIDTTVVWTDPDLLVQDGISPVSGFIEPENGLVFIRQGFGGTWTPSQLTTDLDVTFVQDGATVARQGYRVTVNTDTALLTGATTPHPLTDLNISRITITPSGSGTSTFTVKFDYSFDGDIASVSETVSATMTGVSPVGTVSNFIYDDLDTTTLAAGPSRYAILSDDGDNTSGMIDNFQDAQAILVNKADLAGIDHGLFYTHTRLGDRIVFFISVTRWFLYEVTTTAVIVGSGSALAYHFDVNLIDYVDFDPNLNHPTASGNEIQFQFSPPTVGLFNLLLDPDFDLSTDFGRANGFWEDQVSDDGSPGVPDVDSSANFVVGGGDQGSNAIDLLRGNWTNGSLSVINSLDRFRLNFLTVELRMRYETRNSGANYENFTFAIHGYREAASTTVTVVGVTTVDIPESHLAWATIRVVVTIPRENNGARFFKVVAGWVGDGTEDATGVIRIDSLFAYNMPDAFGSDTIITTDGEMVISGSVPESDTTSQAGLFLRSDGEWADPAVSGGAAFNGLGIWRHRTETATPPASGQIRFNNASPASATVMYIHETNDGSEDMASFLALLGDGSILYLQDRADASNFFVIELSSFVDSGTYVTLGIENIILQGTEPAQDQPVALFMVSGGGGGGSVNVSGTPVDNQLAVWTSVDTIEGEAALTYGSPSNSLTIINGAPKLHIQNTAASSNEQAWTFRVAGNGDFGLHAAADDRQSSSSAVIWSRVGTTVQEMFITSRIRVGEIRLDGTLFMSQAAGDQPDQSGRGQWWVRDDGANQTPMFTQDDGTQFELLTSAQDLALYAHWVTGGQNAAKMTISTSAAAGGDDGDIHFRYA